MKTASVKLEWSTKAGDCGAVCGEIISIVVDGALRKYFTTQRIISSDGVITLVPASMKEVGRKYALRAIKSSGSIKRMAA